MIKVSKISWLGGHRLSLQFSDASAGEYDFDALLREGGPMAEPLYDPDYFKRVFIEFGAPTWPNGFDVSPEWLHREIASAGKLHRSATV
jgi:hypothetical protein